MYKLKRSLGKKRNMKDIICIKMKFNFQTIGLENQYGRNFFVSRLQQENDTIEWRLENKGNTI